MASYDVFISYRRDGGAAEARLIQSALQSRNVRAFLDVTELGRGYFDDALLRSIEQTPNFVVILSPHALDRAESDEDWLRKEIAHALKSERNVVPLIMPGFQFPPKLPRDLKNLPRHQGMDYSHLYFDAMMQKLLATLDLSASDEERGKAEQAARDRDENDRAERVRLDEDRQQLERARRSVERLKQETDARRRSLELHRQESAGPPADDALRRDRDRAVPRGQACSAWPPPTRTQARARPSMWHSGRCCSSRSRSSRPRAAAPTQGMFAAGAAFLALAVWMRMRASQAATMALVVSALTSLGMVGAALSQRFDLGRVSFAWYAACAAAALWRLTNAAALRRRRPPRLPWTRAALPARIAVPHRVGAPVGASFGRRFGDLIGVGDRIDVPRLRLFIVARLIGGLAYWWAVQASQGMFSSFRVNYLWIIWVSAALPLAFALTFRWLRHPLLSILAAAVIASVVDPVFYQSGFAMPTVAGNLVGSLLFAAAIEDVDDVRIAAWLGSASASLGGVLVGVLWGVRYGGWSQAGPNLYRFTLLSVVFTAAYIGGMRLTERSEH